MKELNSFVAVLRGKSGKYYSTNTLNLGGIPLDEEAKATDIVYDSNTKRMYHAKKDGKENITYVPYISENGKYCRFIDDEIVETN